MDIRALLNRIQERLKPWKIEGGKSFSERLRRLGRIYFLAGWKFTQDFCFERAASLSFATLISLIPLSVLFLSFAGLLGGGQEIINYVEEKVFPFVVPEFKEQLGQWLETYISPTAFQTGPAGLINVAAVFGLLMSALNVLITSERVFNHIWNAPEKRNYIQKLTVFWVILTTSPFMIVASMWIERFLASESGLVETVFFHHWLSAIFYRFILPLLIGFVGFSLLYLFLPSTEVRIKNAAIAGLTSAVLWEISKRGFYLYVQQAGTVTNFYKQLATIPLFLIWLYITWLIILGGAQVSYALQNIEFLERLREKQKAERKYSYVFLGLYILLRAYESFRDDRTAPQLEAMAAEIGVPEQTLREVADLLADRKLLVEDTREPGRFVLVRDPRRIELRRTVEFLHGEEFPGEAHQIFETGEDFCGAMEDRSAVCARDLTLRGYRFFFDSVGEETLENAFERLRSGAGQETSEPAAPPQPEKA